MHRLSIKRCPLPEQTVARGRWAVSLRLDSPPLQGGSTKCPELRDQFARGRRVDGPLNVKPVGNR